VISHKQRLQACLSGEKPDRTPVALWHHFPVDDQTPQGLAEATLAFQRSYDFDLVKVMPPSSYCLKDWGAQDEWRGSTEGTRSYTTHVIQQPEDWRRLPRLDPYAGELGGMLACLNLITSELGADTPVIHTIFSPLAQAKNLAGEQRLLVHMRTNPEALHAGLQTIVESTRRFIQAARQTGIAGIFYAVQHAQLGLLTPQEFSTFGTEYDLQILETSDVFWCNMLHLHGVDVMFDLFLDYPIQIINWHDRDTAPSLDEAQNKFKGAVCGGLQRERLALGSPKTITAEARDAILATGGRRFILGTGCVIPIITPFGNIMATRRSVEMENSREVG
jgi:uroporphyrinogen decarboxylase